MSKYLSSYTSQLELLTAYLEMSERCGIKWEESDIKQLRISRKKAASYAQILEAYSPNEKLKTIATKSRRSVTTVWVCLKELKDLGWLPKYRHNLDSDSLLPEIRELFFQGKSAREIGRLICRSDCHVRSLIAQFIEKTGITLTEAALVLRRSRAHVSKTARDNGVGVMHHSEQRITEMGLAELIFLLGTGEKHCVVCRQAFVPKNKSSRCCSEKCRSKERYQRHANRRYKPEAADSKRLKGWRRELYGALHSQPCATKDRWVEHKEALQISGLSRMQLRWLMSTSVLHMREHPTKKWLIDNNQPTRLCLESELMLARAVYERFKAKP